MRCVARQAPVEGGAGAASEASGCDPAAGCGAPQTTVFTGAFAVASPKGALLRAAAPSWTSEGKRLQGLVMLALQNAVSGLSYSVLP